MRLQQQGAEVIGIDASQKLLDYARDKTGQIEWIRDDAMELKRVHCQSIDIAVCNLMLMDVPNIDAVFKSVHKILQINGLFIFVIMHPCFQSPFSYWLDDGTRNVSTYVSQFWKSKGTNTLRANLGAYHRSVSEYVNGCMAAGFSIIHIDEPMSASASQTIPSLFGFVGEKKVKLLVCVTP